MENSTDSTLGVEQLGVVGELVFDIAAAEPDQRRAHAVGIEEEVGHVEQADDAFGRTEAAGSADVAARHQAERHLNLDQVLVAHGFFGFEAHDDLVEARRAYLLVALLGLDRVGVDQAGALQHLDVDGNGRLRERELAADLVDVQQALVAQELENADADDRSQGLQDVDAFIRVDGQEAGFHRDSRRWADGGKNIISVFLIYNTPATPCRPAKSGRNACGRTRRRHGRATTIAARRIAKGRAAPAGVRRTSPLDARPRA